MDHNRGMNRNERVLAAVPTGGLGLEIGPSYNPIAAKAAGFDVRTMDHASREELVAKYSRIGMEAEQLDRIEEVDFIWTGQPLTDAVNTGERFDYIIASHVIEHTVDPIAFLNECGELLSDNGVICLVVPDKRFCFDHFRPLSSAGQLVEAHLFPRPVHGPASFVDTHLLTVRRNGTQNTWTATTADGIGLVPCPWETVGRTLSDIEPQDTYIDIHRWVFTPASFRLLAHDLAGLGYLRVAVEDVSDAHGYEFFTTMRKGSTTARPFDIASDQRWQMLMAVQADLRAGGLRPESAKRAARWRHPGATARGVAGRARRKVRAWRHA